MEEDYGQQQFIQFEDESNGYNELEIEEEEDAYQANRGQKVRYRGDYSDRKRVTRDDASASLGKLFVGGISWDTTEERFTNYFSKFGEIADSVIMIDKYSGRPRGFGFVTFADPSIADKVLEECHVIDGREVEVKRTIPRENMERKPVMKVKKIFVGGIPLYLTEDELKEYFSIYGNIVDYQIMLDHNTGRSRGFGFVTFDSEDAVDRVLLEGKVHELGGKQVEIKRAEPKRAFRGTYDDGNDGNVGEYNSGGRFGGKMDRGYGGAYGGYGGYNCYGGYYAGNSAAFYGGFGGYGYGYGYCGPMYCGGGYPADSGFGASNGYDASNHYGNGAGYGNKSHRRSGSSGSGGSTNGGGKGHGNVLAGGCAERYHPYGR